MAQRAKKQWSTKTVNKENPNSCEEVRLRLFGGQQAQAGSSSSSSSAQAEVAACAAPDQVEALLYIEQQQGGRQLIGKLIGAVDSQCQGQLVHQLTYRTWQPRDPLSRKSLLPQQALRWEAYQQFKQGHQFLLTIFAQARSPSIVSQLFSWPDTYTLNGSLVWSALEQHRQRLDYIKTHQERFHGSDTQAPAETTSAEEVLVVQGPWLKQATLALNTAGEAPVVTSITLNVPALGALDEVAGQGSTSSNRADTQREPQQAAQGIMATSVVSLTSPRQPMTQVDPGCADTSPPAQAPCIPHDGGVLEPPKSEISTALRGDALSGHTPQQEQGNNHDKAKAGGTGQAQLQHVVTAGHVQQSTGSAKLRVAVADDSVVEGTEPAADVAVLQNGKRYDVGAGSQPRNGKVLPHRAASPSDPSLHHQRYLHGSSLPQTGVRTAAAAEAVVPSDTWTASGRVQQVQHGHEFDSTQSGFSHSSDGASPGPGQQRSGTMQASQHELQHSSSAGMSGGRVASGNLDAFGSAGTFHGSRVTGARSHSNSNHAGWGGGGGHTGSGHGNHSTQAFGRDRRASRGSYGNLQTAAGGPSKGYQGRNGAYGSNSRGGGGSASSSRASMDDMLMAQHVQHGGGPGQGRGMQRGGDGGNTSGGGPGSMQEAGVHVGPEPLEPSTTTDLERFMMQITPMINVDFSSQPAAEALQSLCLEDVWRFYLEPSLYAREVYTLGGPRGPSLSYFVPYLSAIQLFTPASNKDPSTNRLYISDTDGWPRHMHLRYEHFETDLPFNRHPMYERLDILSGQLAASSQAGVVPAAGSAVAGSGKGKPGPTAGAAEQHADTGKRGSQSSWGSGEAEAKQQQQQPQEESGDASPGAGSSQQGPGVSSLPRAPASSDSWLRTTQLAELHPASWYCVAWYPVYRIPDAPLNTRFLTFHSFAPLVTSIQNALLALQEGQQRPLSVLPVGVVGLKWNNMIGERWLEPLAPVPSGSKAEEEQAGGQAAGFGRGNRRHTSSYARMIDSHFQAHLSELQATAERLARGHGVRVLGAHGVEDCRQRHPDFEFFNSRG